MSHSIPTHLDSFRRPLGTVSLRGIEVLIIENSEDLRDLYSFIVTRAGGTPVATSTADEACVYLQSNALDVVVSDFAGETSEGAKTIASLRSRDSAKAGIPAIALSADSYFKRAALKAGFDWFLLKPTTAGLFLRTIFQAGLSNRKLSKGPAALQIPLRSYECD